MAEQPAAPPPDRTKRTLFFTVGMAAVVGTFFWLSSLQGPPMMGPREQHKGLKDDTMCLSCHNWSDAVAKGAPGKALGPNHPPARPKKHRPTVVDGGLETSNAPLWECIKCHAPR